MSASNDAPGWPADPDRNPITVTTSGWYTFQSRFYDAGAGVLAVDMSVLSGSTVLRTWTLSDSTDIIGTTVGGNGYAWLVDNGFTSLALDNITRSGVLPTCAATGLHRDGIDLTAALVNPAAPVTGSSTPPPATSASTSALARQGP
jgi:hypothetical protein